MALRSLSLATAVAALLAAGCGGDDSETDTAASSTTTTAERPTPPEPSQPFEEQVPIFQRAVADGECEDALAVLHTAELTHPDDPESERNCKDAVAAVGAYDSFEPTASQEFGTGAIVDGRSDGREIALIWALDEDGRFKWIRSEGIHPTIGTEPRVDFERPAVEFVDALRAGDCKAARAALAPNGRLAYDDEKTFCELFEENFMTAPEGLGSRLSEDPDAEPLELGATRDWAFYGVATAPAGYRTLVVVGPRERGEPAVWDVVPTER